METMNALLLTGYGGPEVTQLHAIAAPIAGDGQVLVRVHAAGLNALDWKIRQGLVRDAFPLQLPAVLGIELAGTVVAVGSGASRFKAGDRVMGPLGGLGAYAELAAVNERNLAVIPDGLSDEQAAALGVPALAAWQSLHAAGPVTTGQRILVHGAGGALGGFAVQFAKRLGATVIATARGADRAWLRDLGADQVIDYREQAFEKLVSDIDLVLDYVGGQVQERSWSVLKDSGAIVATSSPEILARTPAGRRGLWFVMQPDSERLGQFAREVAAGTLQQRVGEVLDFADLPAAIGPDVHRTLRGKAVVRIPQ